MPSYEPAGISIYLGATALAPTITRDLRLRKNEAAKNLESHEKLLRESERLDEATVQLPGDTRGFRVGFLKNVPFLQVQVGQTLWTEDDNKENIDKTTRMKTPCLTIQDQQRNGENLVGNPNGHGTSGRVTRAHLKASAMPDQSQLWLPPPPSYPLFPPVTLESQAPKALSLHVLLSEKTFLPSFEDEKPQMLMIDVFFNGMLASSVLMHLRDISSGVKEMHQIFAGDRIDFLIERPWVIFPPEQYACKNSRGIGKGINPRQRWEQICAALLRNAEERGYNKCGERPPTGDYLESLASMEMPDRVQAMQTPGGRNFGVLDVVVTAGYGQKVVGSYLSEPTRMPDPRYRYKSSTQRSEAEKSGGQSTGGQCMSNMRILSDQVVPRETQPELRQELPALPPPSTWPSFPPLDNVPPWSSGFASQSGSSFMDFGYPMTSGQPFISSQPPSSNYAASEHEPAGTINPLNLELFPSSLPSNQGRSDLVDEANMSPFGPMAPPEQILPLAQGMGITKNPGDIGTISNFIHCPPNNNAYFEAGPRPRSTLAPPRFPYLGPVKYIGPLPPVGRFSVPKLSSPVDPGYIDSSQPRSSELVSRAIITSKGNVVVDHRWPVAQRVANKSKTKMRNQAPARQRRKSPGSAEFTVVSASSQHQRKSTRGTRLETPPPTSPGAGGTENTKAVISTARKDRYTGETHMNGGPKLDSAAPNGMLPPKVGPKANPYIFDDPEKLLRSDPRPGPPFIPAFEPGLGSRRASRSANRASVVPGSPVKGQPSTVIDLLIPESGSLLNTPNSLKSKHSKISHPGAEPSIIKATLPSSAIHDTAKISVANIGGTASTFNPAPDTCPPHTPAQSLNAKAPRQIATPLTSAPITSDTEKKRKRTRVDEFKTIDNPPLNQDCVIAFAESADGETAVLRQVKCEKPGVFTEDMIVCGMRFFIAG